MRNQEPDVLTAPDVAKILQIPLASVWRAVRNGKIPHFRLGDRLVRFHRSSIIEWMRVNGSNAQAAPVSTAMSREDRQSFMRRRLPERSDDDAMLSDVIEISDAVIEATQASNCIMFLFMNKRHDGKCDCCNATVIPAAMRMITSTVHNESEGTTSIAASYICKNCDRA